MEFYFLGKIYFPKRSCQTVFDNYNYYFVKQYYILLLTQYI